MTQNFDIKAPENHRGMFSQSESHIQIVRKSLKVVKNVSEKCIKGGWVVRLASTLIIKGSQKSVYFKSVLNKIWYYLWILKPAEGKTIIFMDLLFIFIWLDLDFIVFFVMLSNLLAVLVWMNLIPYPHWLI